MTVPSVYPYLYDFSCDLDKKRHTGLKAIYALCDPDGDVRYIGRTARPDHRLSEHWSPGHLAVERNKTKWLRERRASGQHVTLRVLLWVPASESYRAEEAYIAEGWRVGLRLTNMTHPKTFNMTLEQRRAAQAKAATIKRTAAACARLSQGQYKRFERERATAPDGKVKGHGATPETRAILAQKTKERWNKRRAELEGTGQSLSYVTPEGRARVGDAARKRHAENRARKASQTSGE